MKITTNLTTDGHYVVSAILDRTLAKADELSEAVALIKTEVAKKVWEDNQTQIMAQMDLKGLAALIAIEASKALKK